MSGVCSCCACDYCGDPVLAQDNSVFIAGIVWHLECFPLGDRDYAPLDLFF